MKEAQTRNRIHWCDVFFSEGKSFDHVTDEQLAYVENWINNLPRKILHYKSAKEIFQSVLFVLAI